MRVVINADDFGKNENCNRAIVEAYRLGLISSTSVMSNSWAYKEAASFAKSTRIETGVHLNLTDGEPLTYPLKADPSFCGGGGSFNGNALRVTKLENAQKEHVFNELCAQIDRMREDGLDCLFADSHQHFHYMPAYFPIVCAVLREKGVGIIRPANTTGGSLKGRLYRRALNGYFKLMGFKTVGYFYGTTQGHPEELSRRQTAELMVHPMVTKENVLVDKIKAKPLEESEPLQDAIGRCCGTGYELVSHRL